MHWLEKKAENLVWSQLHFPCKLHHSAVQELSWASCKAFSPHQPPNPWRHRKTDSAYAFSSTVSQEKQLRERKKPTAFKIVSTSIQRQLSRKNSQSGRSRSSSECHNAAKTVPSAAAVVDAWRWQFWGTCPLKAQSLVLLFKVWQKC